MKILTIRARNKSLVNKEINLELNVDGYSYTTINKKQYRGKVAANNSIGLMLVNSEKPSRVWIDEFKIID